MGFNIFEAITGINPQALLVLLLSNRKGGLDPLLMLLLLSPNSSPTQTQPPPIIPIGPIPVPIDVPPIIPIGPLPIPILPGPTVPGPQPLPLPGTGDTPALITPVGGSGGGVVIDIPPINIFPLPPSMPIDPPPVQIPGDVTIDLPLLPTWHIDFPWNSSPSQPPTGTALPVDPGGNILPGPPAPIEPTPPSDSGQIYLPPGYEGFVGY